MLSLITVYAITPIGLLNYLSVGAKKAQKKMNKSIIRHLILYIE